MTDAVLELRRLAAELAELRDAHDALLRHLLKRDDRRTGSALLPLAAEVMGDAPFHAAELLGRAVNDLSPTGEALRGLIREYATEAGGLRSFGRLLDRLDGAALGGYRLVPAGTGREGRRWRLSRVSER